jgi:hypothetical protein
MKPTILRLAPAILAIALLAIAPCASAAITPESDVLVPWFEIDLQKEDVGLATIFSVVNAYPEAAKTKFIIYTNWGIPVLEVPITFQRTEAKTIELREWIRHGRLPERTLTPAELAHLHAALTGKASPNDGLYYGTEYRGLAVGYVIVQALEQRPDSLFGDMYSVDLAANFFGAETLSALTHDLKSDCRRHGIRFSNQGLLFEGSELLIWSGRQFSPSPTPEPGGEKMKVTVEIYDQAGRHVQTCHRALIAVESVEVCHLDISPPIGWLDISTEDPTVIVEHLHSTTQASAELHSYCLKTDLNLAGPRIKIEKKINGRDTERAAAPKFFVGEDVRYEYHVTNTGTVALNPVAVTDDKVRVSCPKNSLAPAETMVCAAMAIAEGCLNRNLGTATGYGPDGSSVTDSDFAYYEGLYAPTLKIETLVNGDEADSPTGPTVDAGDQLNWTFIVKNTGNVRISNIAVHRNGEAADCPKTELDTDEAMICTAKSLAGEGQQHEIGTAKGSDPCGERAVANDPAFYFGRNDRPAIEITKYIGQDDANTAPGPTVEVGATIEWRFLVTNVGNVRLEGIEVIDDKLTTILCPKTALDPGESMVCTATGIALPCEQTNEARVRAGVGTETARNITDTDVAHYFGRGAPQLALELKLNGDNADDPPGAWIYVGATIQFAYEVTNSGNVPLSNIVVHDDFDRIASCPKTTLEPGESMTCTATTAAVPGTHEIIGTALGWAPCGNRVEANDPAFYRSGEQ